MIRKLIGALAISLLFATNGHAATMSITSSDFPQVGETVQLEIWGDFTGEGLIAGGITFFWDATFFELEDIRLNFPVLVDSCPDFIHCPPNTADSAPIFWSAFLSDLIGPADPAPILMATLDFTVISALAAGLGVFSMETNGSQTGGWFGAGFTPIPTAAFGTSQFFVPLPASIWFMIGCLGTLSGFRRK